MPNEDSDFDKQSYISDGLRRHGIFTKKSVRRPKKVLCTEPEPGNIQLNQSRQEEKGVKDVAKEEEN